MDPRGFTRQLAAQAASYAVPKQWDKITSKSTSRHFLWFFFKCFTVEEK